MNELHKQGDPFRVSEKLLSLEVTSHCNIQCLHCFVNHQIHERSSLSFDVVKDIIKEGHDLGYRRLHVTGGEPLIWKELFEALDYAFYLGYKTVLINTNGILLSKETCGKLASYNGVIITVSLDGPEKLHNRIRGEGSYRLTMRGLENAVNALFEPVVFTTAYKMLLPELPNFVKDLYREFPTIKYLSLIPLTKTSDNGFALSEDLLGAEDFIRLVRIIPFLNLSGLKIEILNDPLSKVASKFLKNPFIQWSHPIKQESSLIIRADGMISSSHFSRTFFRQYKPGLIQEVLRSDQYGKSVLQNDTICPYCDYNQICSENGMYQPSDAKTELHNSELFCRNVLDIIC
jgi:MoaA/NifB/PqqE/SkfB family radical SAM enzyme